MFTQHEMDRLLDDMVRDEYEAKRILLKLKKPRSVKEIASVLNMKPNVVLQHILDLKRHELIEIHEIRDNTPAYVAKIEEGVE